MRKALVLGVLSVMALAGCGDGDENESPNKSTTTTLSKAVVEGLEKRGVRVSKNGELWAKDCKDASLTRAPAGKRIIC